MKKRPANSSILSELNISYTAYRALFVLGLLLEKPRSRKELVDLLKMNEITSKYFSLDILRFTMNSLKASGCIITRPNVRNGFVYTLISHPFRIEIPDAQLECLNMLRNNLLQLGDWQLILKINDLYEKIVSKTNNDEKVSYIKISEPFADIDKKILEKLIKSNIKNREISLIYNSARHGMENLRIVADSLICENGRLYLWCYLFKYESFAYLRVDRIKVIESISLYSKPVRAKSYKAQYTVSGDSVVVFREEQNERIIERDDKSILVEVEVINEFKLIQRLMLLGSDFNVVSPDFLKKDIISKLKSIRQGYCI